MIEFIGKDIYNRLSINECTSINYNDIVNSIENNNECFFLQNSYKSFFQSNASVFHFPNPFEVPHNIPYNSIVTVHDCIALMDNIDFNANSRVLFKATIDYLKRHSDILIIVDSESVKKDLIQFTDIYPERIFVIPLAFDESIHFHECNTEELQKLNIFSPYLLYLGVLDFRKGIVDILDAYELLKPRFKELKLVLAGDLNPYVKSIPERLNNYKYIDDVILTGYVSDKQKRALLSSAEVFLFPSEYEGFGIPVLEAMACGCPVITTNISSLPEVGGDAAVYVSPKSPEDISCFVEKLLNSQSYRNEHINKGYIQSRKFSWDKTAFLTEKIYRLAGDNSEF